MLCTNLNLTRNLRFAFILINKMTLNSLPTDLDSLDFSINEIELSGFPKSKNSS